MNREIRESAPSQLGERRNSDENKRELTKEDQHKIDSAVAMIDQLVKDGDLPNRDVYLYLEKVDNPRTQGIIDKVHEDLGYDSDMIRIVNDRVDELRRKRETEQELASAAKLIAEVSFLGKPGMSDSSNRRLWTGIKDHNIDSIVSALRDMEALPKKQIEKLITIAVKKDNAELLFSTIDEELDKLERDANHRMGLI